MEPKRHPYIFFVWLQKNKNKNNYRFTCVNLSHQKKKKKSPKSLLVGLFLKLIPMLIDEHKSNFEKLSQHCCEIKEI